MTIITFISLNLNYVGTAEPAGWLVLFSEWKKVAEEEEEHVGRLISSVAMIPKMLPASAALENEII